MLSIDQALCHPFDIHHLCKSQVSLSGKRDRYSDILLSKIKTVLAHVTDVDLLLQPLLDPSVVIVPRVPVCGPDFQYWLQSQAQCHHLVAV